MSFEEEEALLKAFFEKAENGRIVSVSEIETAYRESAGHSIGTGQIYHVLQRHEWRKAMPRGRHQKKADEETIEGSKKLNAKPHEYAFRIPECTPDALR